MRITKYAKELATAKVDIGNGEELRIEKLFIKEKDREEIRFSWWKNNKFITRPPDGTVEEWLDVFKEAIDKNVLPTEFIDGLKKIL